MNEIQEIKTANPLPNAAEAYGVSLKQSGRGFIGRCPFHNDRNPSFYIYLVDSGWRFKCYGGSCGLEGDVIDFIGLQLHGQAWNNRNPAMFKDALRALGAEDQGRTQAVPAKNWDVTASKPVTYQETTPQIVRAWDLALKLYQDILLQTPEALAYVHARGLTDETIRRFHIGCCPRGGSGIEALARLAKIDRQTLLAASLLREYRPEEGDPRMYEYFGGRITFADLDYQGNVRYIVGRKLPTETDPGRDRKYIGLAGFPKTVFNLHRTMWKREPVFVVEAPLDAISIDQIGFDAVALHGTNPSSRQIEAMQRLQHPVFVADNDPAGQAAVEAWRQAIPTRHPDLKLPTHIDGVGIKDPNDLIARLEPESGERIFRQLAKAHGWRPR
ncbi:MAG TPA: CHC2 zinc finger domain-containing protein [Anaerolineales bacterium]|nr:CHC2 zinc finger domain-containing protein [Anaerolineales bacterium]